MQILADENIPRVTVDHLRSLGYDVLDVRGTEDQGILDGDLWAIAIRDDRLLITTDRGFTEYRGEPHSGILVVRLRQPNRVRIHDAVLLAIDRFPATDWPGMLVVVRDTTLSVSRRGGQVEKS